MSRESVIGKVRKLLALAGNNPSQQEALSAALKAQKIIAEYDISEEELGGGGGEREILSAESEESSRNAMYSVLAARIANDFRCKCWISSRNCKKTAHFYGYEEDAVAARSIFDFLFAVMNRQGNAEKRKAVKEGSGSAGVYNAFCWGFVRGVCSELDKQSKELMLAISEEVKDAYEGFSKDFGRARNPRMAYNPYNRGARARGEAAGRDTVRSTRLGGQLALGA